MTHALVAFSWRQTLRSSIKRISALMQPSQDVRMETSDQGDIQGNMAWKHAEDYFMRLHSPTFGKVNLATDLCASKDGTKISFTGKIWDKLEGSPTSRICIIDLSGLLSSTATLPASGFKVVTRGPNNDSHGRWSPDGETLAFLSDREEKGINQLYLLKGSSLGEAFLACRFQGSVEYFHWDSKGSRILIAVAGLDADVGDADGSGKIGDSKGKVPDWMPTVTAGVSKSAWRDLYVYELGEGVAKNLATPLNVWDASWYGENEVIAVATTEPGEGEWYRPLLLSLRFDSHDADIDTSEKGLSTHQPLTGRSTNDDMTLKKPALRVKTRHLYASKVQLGGPTSTPSGKTFAVLEALCSDRDLFAGNVVLGQDDAIEVVELDVDITYIEWRNESALFCMGIRGPSSIAGEIVLRDGGIKGAYFVESWRSSSHCGGTYPSGTAFSKSPFAVMVEDWDLYPEMRLVNEGRSQVIISFAHFGSEHLSSIIGSKEQVKWNAPDGLELDGFLQLPKFGHKPYPLILAAHGGPVFSFRNRWPGSSETAYLSSLSYAILSTNPRGSSGRGQHFAARVLGDIGGGETQDHLSGIDAMIKCGIADPERIGVMGASHGGFMSSWLITQDDRFKAAVPIAAINDWRSQHTTTNISAFNPIFHRADPYALPSNVSPSRKDPYITRSPLMHVRKVRTPVLQIAGSQDLCVPDSQAKQFHNALKECGVESTLVVYPREGHGVKSFPAFIDFCARIAMWFERFMPVDKDPHTS